MMQKPGFTYKPFIYVSYILTLFLLITSCERRIDNIPKADILNMPAMTVKNDTTVYSDSGRVEMIMTFPLMEQYENSGQPYYEFSKGLNVQVYDGKPQPTGFVSSKYAKYSRPGDVWELKDSVVVVNEQNDKLETEELYWDQKKDLIYSDRFVRFTNQDQIVMGTGFESDPHLRKRKIRKVSATIYLKDEE
jgi:LPS export ABC transporter protein LptC